MFKDIVQPCNQNALTNDRRSAALVTEPMPFKLEIHVVPIQQDEMTRLNVTIIHSTITKTGNGNIRLFIMRKL